MDDSMTINKENHLKVPYAEFIKKQVATVTVVTVRIATEHGSFNRIRQVAPICTHYPQCMVP